MRITLLLLTSILFSSGAFATTEKEINAKMAELKKLQDRVSKECINNKNSLKYRVEVAGKTLNCSELLVITDQLKKELDKDVTEYKESCLEKNKEAGLHTKLATEAADIAEKSATCTPSPDSKQCLSKFSCSMVGAVAPLKMLMSVAGSAFKSQALKSCSAQNGMPGCLLNVLRGIFDSIWSSLSMIWEAGKWALKKTGEFFGIIKKSEAKTSERAMMAQQAGPSFLKRLASNPMGVLKQMAKDLYDSLEAAAINHYGCEQWSGLPFRSSCKKPMTTWKCGSCQQKAQVYCGIAGYAIGEIGTAFLTGGLVSGGKVALKGAVKIASGPAKNVAAFMGKTFPKSAAKVASAAGKVKVLATVGLSAAQSKIVAGWNVVKNSKVTKSIGGYAKAATDAKVVKIAALPLKPIGMYLRAMDKAFVAGGNTVEKALTKSSTKVIREEAIQGAKLADEAMGVASESVDAGKASQAVKEVTQDAAQASSKPSGLVIQSSVQDAKTTVKISAPVKASSTESKIVSSESKVSKAEPKSSSSSSKAASESDELADVAKYRTDPEYAQLFKGPEMYEDHHKELGMVIRAMEETQPKMTKIQIRQKIQETLNSCQL